MKGKITRTTSRTRKKGTTDFTRLRQMRDADIDDFAGEGSFDYAQGRSTPRRLSHTRYGFIASAYIRWNACTPFSCLTL